jgi:hypothetical protein
MRVVVLFCLVASAAIWGVALLAPKPSVEPLPERFQGSFRLALFRPAEGSSEPPPLPPGAPRFTFRAEGSYLLATLTPSGEETSRREGVASVDGNGVLTLAQVSSNRREDPAPPERYHAEWGQDEEGPYLSLRHAARGYTLLLRPVAE